MGKIPDKKVDKRIATEKYSNLLNRYVLNYLDHDNTNSALMLTGPWGSGKSFYIRHELARFLDEQKQPRSCVIVSLYGIDSLEELSKKIFIAVNLRFIERKQRKKEEKRRARANEENVEKERKHTFFKTIRKILLKIIGRTLKKTVTRYSKTVASSIMQNSPIKIDASIDQRDIIALYRSVNLTNVLLVIEDLERTKIDVVEALGYINSLVEEDQAKVLIVANEDEIEGAKEEKSIPNSKEEENVGVDEEASVPKSQPIINKTPYLRIKEKTVSDTLIFIPDKKKAVVSILKDDFIEEPVIASLLKQSDFINKVVDVMDDAKDNNFRTLIYAAQKTCDIFRNVENDTEFKLDTRFSSEVFLNLLKRAIIVKRGELLESKGETSEEEKLLFVSQYMAHHENLDKEAIERQQRIYLANLATEEAKGHIRNLSGFYEIKEEEIKSSINKVKADLKQPVSMDKNGEVEIVIPYTLYATLGHYLTAIEVDIPSLSAIAKECKDIMIENLRTQSYDHDDVLESLHGLRYTVIFDDESTKQSRQFFEEMKNVVQEREKEAATGESIIDRLIKMGEDRQKIYSKEKTYLGAFDIEKVAEAIITCDDPVKIERVRALIDYNYAGVSNAGEFLSGDLEALENLKTLLNNKKESVTDGVCKLQIKWLLKNIESSINNLKGQSSV